MKYQFNKIFSLLIKKMLEDLISIPFWFFFSIPICVVVVVVVVVVGGGGGG